MIKGDAIWERLKERNESKVNKSVYSLVLADDVVEAIDRLAYSMNTSRSNLINQILAERVQLLTPEKRMREIFAKIEQLMDSRFQTLNQPSDAMMSIKSPLRYKYKPTIRYGIELSRDFHGKVGRLKVSFRTQSTQLISMLDSFLSCGQGSKKNIFRIFSLLVCLMKQPRADFNKRFLRTGLSRS